MRVLYIVNTADAQSIPLELGRILAATDVDVRLVAFYRAGHNPIADLSSDVVHLEARHAFDPRALWRLRSEIARFAPDIVHMHHAVSYLWTALMAGRHTRKVKTEHNDARENKWFQNLISRSLAGRTDLLICNSKTTLASLPRNVRAQTSASVIYNGIDLSKVRPKTPTSQTGGPFILGTVGRLVRQKNHLRLIEGFAWARARLRQDIRLEIIGEGPLRPELEAASQRLGLDAKVALVGGLAREQVYDRLHRWHGFVMPSLFEGFCNALVEAAATGLPVAYSDIQTLREVMGDTGIRFSPTEPIAIAEAISSLSKHSPNIHDHEFKKYDIRNSAKAHIKAYKELVHA